MSRNIQQCHPISTCIGLYTVLPRRLKENLYSHVHEECQANIGQTTFKKRLYSARYSSVKYAQTEYERVMENVRDGTHTSAGRHMRAAGCTSDTGPPQSTPRFGGNCRGTTWHPFVGECPFPRWEGALITKLSFEMGM